jgi:hypothetical protein
MRIFTRKRSFWASEVDTFLMLDRVLVAKTTKTGGRRKLRDQLSPALLHGFQQPIVFWREHG